MHDREQKPRFRFETNGILSKLINPDLRFRNNRVSGPSSIPVDSYCVLYATGAAKMIIPAVAVVARVTTTIGINDDFLANFQAYDSRAEGVDRARKFMAKNQKTLLLARKRSLKQTRRN